MTTEIATLCLGIWGSCLSTILAVITIWRAWCDRARLTTSYCFSDPNHGGNEVIIENPSATPVMISYWELLWKKRNRTWLETVDGRFPDEGYCNITIEAHGRHTLRFEGQEYFDWGAAAIKKGKLYLSIHIVGRKKPMLLKIYDPQK